MLKEFIKAWKSDNLLNQAWEQSYEMLDISREMFNESVRVLRKTDSNAVSIDIRKKDKIINEYEREVRRKVMTHCSIGGTGLIGGMILTSIVIDIERIGDYTKNILDLAINHTAKLSVDEYNDTMTAVESHIRYQFDNISTVLKTNNIDSARLLVKKYQEEIKDACDDMVNSMVMGKIQNVSVSTATAFVLYARYLKRISSHLTNILTSVINPFDRIGFIEKEPID